MTAKQRGFTLVEILLLLVVLSIIIFTCWYVRETKKAGNENLEKASNSSNEQISSEVDKPFEWFTHKNEELGLSFSYPKNWEFKEKSPTYSPSTKSHDIGELGVDDKTDTNVVVSLIREQDGRNVRSSMREWIENWKELNKNNPGVIYKNFQRIGSTYSAFSFSWYAGIDNATEIGLQYVILPPGHEVGFLVLPAHTEQRATIDKIAKTIKIEQ